MISYRERCTSGSVILGQSQNIKQPDCGLRKKLNVSIPGHLERDTDFLEKLSNFCSLVNDSVRYSYDDFQDKWTGGTKQ